MTAIQTRRLVLREFRAADFEALHAFASDPEVTRYTSFGPNSPEQTKAFLASAISQANTKPRHEYALAVELTESGAMIGSCGVGKANNGQYEVGYVLAKEQWGRGLATELVSALADFAFRRLNARKIWAPVDANNDASCRVLLKAGFTQEGFLKQDSVKWPEGRDTKLFGLLADEWWHASMSTEIRGS